MEGIVVGSAIKNKEEKRSQREIGRTSVCWFFIALRLNSNYYFAISGKRMNRKQAIKLLCKCKLNHLPPEEQKQLLAQGWDLAKAEMRFFSFLPKEQKQEILAHELPPLGEDVLQSFSYIWL